MADAPASATREAILDSLRGSIPPRRVSPLYRVGLALVAFAMVLLPLAYLAIVGAAAYGLCYHAIHNIELFDRPGSKKGPFFLYVAPLVIGGVLVLFMVKPLFARAPERKEGRKLKPGDEPLLFAFVQRLCEVVGAPVPREIRVDQRVNASAAFRRGMWSFFGNDLVLTIGMPIVAGLSLRQIAGVLGHEFGHFAQSAGMRMTYVIRSVNAWFARVVYERDAWDDRLAEWARSIDVRAGIVLHVARLFVWLTRKVLWALMMLGHGISSFMLRQMEFDADRYEAWVAGSEEFESTSRAIVEISVASQSAQSDVRTAWNEQRLVDDLPAFIAGKADLLPQEVRAELRKEMDGSRTGWWDTHPSDRDRIDNARREAAEGLLRLALPASSLFADFPALCRAMTRDSYAAGLGKEFREEHLRPVAEFLKDQRVEDEAQRTSRRYLQGCGSAVRPLPLTPLGSPQEDVQAARAALEGMRNRLAGLAPSYGAAFRTYDEADDKVLDAASASALLSIGFVDASPEMAKAKKAWQGERDEGRRAVEVQRGLEPGLDPVERLAAERLTTALRVLASPGSADLVPGGVELAEEATRLYPLALTLTTLYSDLMTLRLGLRGLATLVQVAESSEPFASLLATVASHTQEVAAGLRALAPRLDGMAYPFEHGVGRATLREFVFPETVDVADPASVAEAAAGALDRLFVLRARLFARLAVMAENVESALGLPPLPEPPPAGAPS